MVIYNAFISKRSPGQAEAFITQLEYFPIFNISSIEEEKNKKNIRKQSGNQKCSGKLLYRS